MKDFDELLDEVLREDVAANPRDGLETRVMARIRGEGQSRNRWRSWMLVPAAACLGVVVAVWYVAGRGAPQPEVVVSRASANVSSAQLRQKAESSGESGRALRDAHFSRDSAAAKMGPPADLPKREMFPSPAPVDAFPAPIGVEEAQTAARELRSAKAIEALLDLRREQAEPVRVAAIQIAPLVMDEDGRRVQ